MDLVEGTFYQSLSSYAAVFLNQVLFQRTAVDTDTDRYMIFNRFLYDCLDTFRCSDIAGIDSDLICSILDCCDSKSIIKVDICHKRNINLFLDFRNSSGCFHIRYSAADDLASGSSKFIDLLYRCGYILRSGICHRLNGNRSVTTDWNIAHHYLSCFVSIHSFFLQ